MDYQKLKNNHLREQVYELKGKLSLKKRDNESIFQLQEDTIRKNEEKIVNLRSRVKESRQELAKALNMDYEVIQSALMDRRETQLECKRYDAHTAHKELNEAVCVEQKRLNHFAHQKECRMRRLNDLKLHYRDFMLLQESNFEQEDHKRVRMLSTKLDKMTLKRNTASFINRTYHKTLSKLNKDALYMPNTIDQFEVDVHSNTEELKDLHQIYEVAKKGQEASRTHRIAIERDFYNGKHKRDKRLTEYRKAAKDNSEMPDIEVKTKTYNDMQNNRKNTDPNSKDVPSEMLCKMEPIIKLFSAVTNTGSATEIPEAYQRQIENNKQLTELSQDFQKQLEEKKATHLKLQTSLEQAKFQQTEQSVNAEKKLNSIATSVDDIELQRLTQTSESHGIISLIESVKQGIASLAEKVNATHVEGRATEHNVNRLSLEKQMELITEKMEAMKAAMKTSIGSCSLNSGSWNPEEDPLEYLIKLNSQNCARITVENQDDDNQADNFLIDDTIMNEQYRTYDDVKGGTQKNGRRKR